MEFKSYVRANWDNEKNSVSFTSTYRPPTKKEYEKEIVELAKKMAKLRWWESKSKIIERMRICAGRLNKLKQ
jgi:hypothetical protein